MAEPRDLLATEPKDLLATEEPRDLLATEPRDLLAKPSVWKTAIENLPFSHGIPSGPISLKPIFQPLSQTLVGKTAKGEMLKRFERKPEGEKWTPALLRSFVTREVGDFVDAIQTPLTYILPKVGEAALKTPPVQMFIRKHTPTFAPHLFRPITPSEEAYVSWLKKPTISPTPQELVSSQLKPTSPPETVAVTNIMQALKEAKPIRAEQEKLYSIERGKRVAEVARIGKEIPGEAGYYAQLGALKGELPKVEFEGIKGKITQPDVESLFNTVENSHLLPLEKVTTKGGLVKLLGAKGGQVPTEGELKLLSEVFPPEFIQTVLSKQPIMQRLFRVGEEVLNVPRAIMASTDLSFGFRQGLFVATRHPIIFLKGASQQFKYFFS